MKFRVTPMRERGVRLSWREIDNRESVVGHLIVYECPDAPGGEMILIAALHGENKTAIDLLPPLMNVEITGASLLAFTLAGFERIQGRRGVVDVRQESYLRAP